MRKGVIAPPLVIFNMGFLSMCAGKKLALIGLVCLSERLLRFLCTLVQSIRLVVGASC